jgi:hypothetical protein
MAVYIHLDLDMKYGHSFRYHYCLLYFYQKIKSYLIRKQQAGYLREEQNLLKDDGFR